LQVSVISPNAPEFSHYLPEYPSFSFNQLFILS
jgi:hypothetical protein